MNNSASRFFLATIPVCLSLALGVVACGGSDDGGSKSSGGSSSMSTAGSSSGGSGNATAGSANNGGSTTNNGSGFDSGLPNDKPLGMLTSAESDALCDKLGTYFSSGPVGAGLQDFNCRLAGLLAVAFSQPMTDAELQSGCQAAYDACKKAPPQNQTEECTPPDATCTATAAELEACMTDSVAYLQQVESAFPSCSEITLADLQNMETPDAPAEPTSCTTFEMKCPNGPSLPSGSMP